MQADANLERAQTRGAEGEQLSALELGAWQGMLRTHARLTREMDAEMRARHGISLSAYELLCSSATRPGGGCACRSSPPRPCCR